MKSMPRKLSVTLCLSQIALLCATGSPAFCVSPTSSVQSEESQLASYEKILFGQPHAGGEIESRLDALERNLFGSAKSGSTNTRLGSIGKALAGSKSDFLLPPLAPKFDFSSGNSNKDFAPSAGGSAGGSGYLTETMDEASKKALQQATTLYSQGRTAEAENAFKHVLTLNIRSVDAYFNLGVIAETRGDLQTALNYYQSASRINPSDLELSNAVSAVQSKIAQKIVVEERARSQQQEAAELSSVQQSRESLKQIAADAQAAYKAGNFDRAIANLRMVEAQAPNDPDVQYALAQAYKGRGDLQNSRMALNRALAIDPNNRLYQTAMYQLNSRSQGFQAGAPAPGLAGSGYQSPDDRSGRPFQKVPYTAYSDQSSGSPVGWQSADNFATGQATGQLTPFTSQGESTLPGSGAHRGGVSGSGFYYGTGSGYGTKTRLTRVALGVGAGLAFGAMFGASSHHMGRSMMSGALLGGALGLLSGGR